MSVFLQSSEVFFGGGRDGKGSLNYLVTILFLL